MGKRSAFERNPRDFYPTPPEAVAPLLPHLDPRSHFVEPCAGNLALVDVLVKHGLACVGCYDIEPQDEWVSKADALTERPTYPFDYFITNPPWSRDILHPLIDHLTSMASAWLLLDADWMHTKQAAPYLKKCGLIVSVGRVKWIPGSKMTGKDNCAWYLFYEGAEETQFIGRA